MRFAAIFSLRTSFATAVDGGKQPEVNSILSPKKQMELATDEYKKLVTSFCQWRRVVQAPAIAKGIIITGDPMRTMMLAMHKKRSKVINLSKSLTIQPNAELYEKSKARRIAIAFQMEKIYKKHREIELSGGDLASNLAKFDLENKTEDLSIELHMVTLAELVNTPLP